MRRPRRHRGGAHVRDRIGFVQGAVGFDAEVVFPVRLPKQACGAVVSVRECACRLRRCLAFMDEQLRYDRAYMRMYEWAKLSITTQAGPAR